ncbi:hypothetical protein RHIZ_06170 [Rhizobium skierniewicense]|uniref:hypothetical protein n=1 Tax=Rhizobium skierniewicense TaxID=984260 RepID=UPI001FAB9637|nr:hypothetical protein [Rhizobium skierniewicense]MCI9865526.1 hypothetical protein [Rhizobium skierniewicense]
MQQAWWSEIGLFLDLIAFAILSWDLVSSINGERTAREDVLAVERKAFNARYGVFAPDQDALKQEEIAYTGVEAARRAASDKSILLRQRWAYAAIGIATIGFAMQIYGGWPT